MVVITDKIYQTRARFVLQGGLFTITGRMHAAVSTFQGGKPAISLSYSTKFRGVIGDSLDQQPLVIEADHDALWHSGEIVDRVCEKIDGLWSDYAGLCDRIRNRVKELQQQVSSTLDRIAAERLSQK